MIIILNVLFACGGTAGHINPALAIADELRNRVPDSGILFVGAGNKMENELIPKAGYNLVNIRISGLKRGISPKDILYNIKTLRNLATVGRETSKIIKEFNPQAVVGTGGYVCYPVLKKAAGMKIPTFIHDSNATPGLTTKLLSTIADKVLIAFPELEEEYRKPDRVVFVGTPVRGGFSIPDSGDSEREKNRKKLVVSFWGSLGAKKMNESIIDFIKQNIDNSSFRHIHAAGRLCDAAEMKSRIAQMAGKDELPEDVEIRDYIDNMHTVMSQADLIMCRAGGSTVAELTAMGKPAVLIPSPYVANNEQEFNAAQLVKVGGAVMLDEGVCTGELLYKTVTELLNDETKLRTMSAAQASIGSPKASEIIAEMVIEAGGSRTTRLFPATP